MFNRSHYEDVLVVRVHDLVPEAVWRGRYRIINDFEHGLAAANTRVVKFFLHISKDEQARRFKERQDDPEKRWKYNAGRRGGARACGTTISSRSATRSAATSTDEAPWYVVPADHKWFRNWVVAIDLVGTLKEMDPQFPRPA